MAADLKVICRAETVEAAEVRLWEFEEKCDGKYPTIGQPWPLDGEQISDMENLNREWLMPRKPGNL